MKSCTLLLLAVTLVAMVVDDVNCECCYPPGTRLEPGYACKDCTIATPYCGYGPCNIFGCACSGGCRRGNLSECYRNGHRHGKRSLPEHLVNPAEIFSTIDVNGDSVVDKEEFDQRAKAVTMSPNEIKGLSEEEFLMMEFEKMDKNRDGVISQAEFDNDLM